jgi:hypothetical protein
VVGAGGTCTNHGFYVAHTPGEWRSTSGNRRGNGMAGRGGGREQRANAARDKADLAASRAAQDPDGQRACTAANTAAAVEVGIERLLAKPGKEPDFPCLSA